MALRIRTPLLTSAGAGSVPLYFRPTATSSAGGWTNELDGTTLHTSIDETVASNADYIKSSLNPDLDVCKIAMTASSNPDESQPITIRYLYRKQGPKTIDLRVRLLEGTTEIASYTHSGITTSYVTGEQPLTAPEKAAVGNWGNLFLEFRADVP